MKYHIHKQNSSYYGEVKNGRKHGQGVLTSEKQKYEGKFVKDMKHGHGIENYSNGTIYEGEYVNGQQQGQGNYWYTDGSYYRGQWCSSIKHDQGMYRQGDFEYEGEWRTGKPERQSMDLLILVNLLVESNVDMEKRCFMKMVYFRLWKDNQQRIQ